MTSVMTLTFETVFKISHISSESLSAAKTAVAALLHWNSRFLRLELYTSSGVMLPDQMLRKAD